MDTGEIAYRVADFLKQHLPFSAMDEADLIEFSSRGRVRFHEAHDYVLWQGEPNKFKIFVIQQGTVSLWDEQRDRPELRDVRGVGDLLGVEPFAGADVYEYSARAATDVLIYAFSAFDFEALVLKYPLASQFVAAYGSVTADYQALTERREPHKVFLHELVGAKTLPMCVAETSVREAARAMRALGADAIAVIDANQAGVGVLTTEALAAWVADGTGDREQRVSNLVAGTLRTVTAGASVADGVLALAAEGGLVLGITADGTPSGRLQALVTPRDLAPVFGDQPVTLLHEIRAATTTRELAALNQRVRAFALQHLNGGGSVEWVARFTHLADAAIVRRLIARVNLDGAGACWCLCGAAGRAESLTRLAPCVVLIHDDGVGERGRAAHRQVWSELAECGYLPHGALPFEPAFYAGGVAEWTARYDGWVRDPVFTALFEARALLDLRHLDGVRGPWNTLVASVSAGVDTTLLKILANDCLDSLPPLTFFQDAVLGESGAESSVFELERTALAPLVDVGRVFALAAGEVMGSSTLERLAMARRLLPDHEAIFREAAETLRVLLWQQGKVGIAQGTAGTELPPALLSRHDRHVLKTGFRSILRLIEYTADWKWLGTK